MTGTRTILRKNLFTQDILVTFTREVRIGSIYVPVLLRRESQAEDVKVNDGSHEVHGILLRLQVDPCSTGYPCATGHSCHTMVCIGPWTAGESLLWCLELILHPLPPLFNWPWCLQSCLSHMSSLLSLTAIATVQLFSPLKYVIPVPLPPSLMGSALGQQ